MDLDYILPFAAIPENGREIDTLDDKSELAHRILLVNVLRIHTLGKLNRLLCEGRPTLALLGLEDPNNLTEGFTTWKTIGLVRHYSFWAVQSEVVLGAVNS